MRSLRVFSPAFCLAFALTASSHAELLVITTPGEPPALEHAELALASGRGAPVSWLSLRVRRGPVAVVAALPDAASGEAGLDAWLSALERTGSSNVLLPPGKTDCGKTASFVHVEWPRARGALPDEVTVASADDVSTLLEEQGLALDEALPSAARYMVWSWPAPELAQTTRTLRLVGEAGPVRFTPSSSSPVLVSLLGAGPLELPSEAKAGELGVSFVAGEPSSNFRERLEAWLASGKEPLVEARVSSSIFGWSILADTVSLPPLVRSYAVGLAREIPGLDVEACSEQLQALTDPEAPNPTACADGIDLSLALAAIGPDQPVLERVVLSSGQPISIDAWKSGGDLSPPLLRAARVDDSACPAVPPNPPIVIPPVSGGGTTPPRDGGTTVVVDETTDTTEPYYSDDGCSCAPGRDPYRSEHPATTFSCYTDTSSTSDDSCSSDSSSTSDDSCSSDSSSTSDDSCSSDSSSTSDDSCSSDSSSTSDDSCSGSNGGSYDGDTCTGRAAPGAEPKTKTMQAGLGKARASRPKRVRLSLWATALAAALLPIRRRKPKPGA